MGDADDSYDFSDVAGFVKKFQAGDELVMGCRLPVGGGTILPGAMPWKNRWLGNPVSVVHRPVIFQMPAHDFHSGLRGFTKTAFEKMDLQTTGMEFASEMVIKSTLKGLKISEVPVTLHKDGRSRPPHLKPWRDGWRHLRFMLLFSPRWLFLVPGLMLSSARHDFRRRAVVRQFPARPGWDSTSARSIVACMTVIVGFQLVAFAFFTKVFAIAEGLVAGGPETVARFQNFSPWKRDSFSACSFFWAESFCSRARSGSGTGRILESCRPWRKICAG